MLGRREVLAMLALAASGTAFGAAIRPGPVKLRLPWGEFARTPGLAKLRAAVAALKANGDIKNPGSWLFWANIHATHCPHGKPYFLSWHRGYLALFERKLGEMAGDPDFRLPYWDYYNDPRLPAELTEGDADTNPLWAPRKGSSIAPALGYGAFGAELTGFQRGLDNSFEARVEKEPHNNIHNLIGGKMATMQSPQDIAFWLHHANVDRLWAAWIHAGQGRTMPLADDAYWGGRFDYAAGTAIDRKGTISAADLGYGYADLELPRLAPPVVESAAPPPPSAPPPAPPAPPKKKQAKDKAGAPPPPAVMAAPPPAAARAVPMPEVRPALPMMAFAPGSAIALGSIPVRATATMEPRPAAGTAKPAPPGVGRPPIVGAAPASRGRRQFVLALDQVALTAAGADGGYFFRIYAGPKDEEFDPAFTPLLGTIGPFQIDAAMHAAMEMGRHHGRVRIDLPVSDAVRDLIDDLDPGESPPLDLFFVRVDAEDAPAGDVISIGSYTIEIQESAD